MKSSGIFEIELVALLVNALRNSRERSKCKNHSLYEEGKIPAATGLVVTGAFWLWAIPILFGLVKTFTTTLALAHVRPEPYKNPSLGSCLTKAGVQFSYQVSVPIELLKISSRISVRPP